MTCLMVFVIALSASRVFAANETVPETQDRIIPASIGVNYGQGPAYGSGYGTQQNQYANRQGCLPTGTLCTVGDLCCTKSCKLPGGGASKKARACCLTEGSACDPSGNTAGLDGKFCCRGTTCQVYKPDSTRQGASDVHVCAYDDSED